MKNRRSKLSSSIASAPAMPRRRFLAVGAMTLRFAATGVRAAAQRSDPLAELVNLESAPHGLRHHEGSVRSAEVAPQGVDVVHQVLLVAVRIDASELGALLATVLVALEPDEAAQGLNYRGYKNNPEK